MARSEPALASRLRRTGLADVPRGEQFLVRAGELLGLETEFADQRVVRLIGDAADPDAAVLGLLRFAEALDSAGDAERFREAVRRDRGSEPGFDTPLNTVLLTRLLRVFGASIAFVDHTVRHPLAWRQLDADRGKVLLRTPEAAASALRERLGAALVDASGQRLSGSAAVSAMRAAYRDLVLALVADDLTDPAPADILGEIAAVLSDLAAAAIDTGLEIVAAETEGSERVRLTVIGMGKCGARELNYVSDVDVVYVWAPADEADVPADDRELVGIATRLAQGAAESCAAAGPEPALWEVDAALRPEGRSGPLVRRLSEMRAYYAQWAENWEFQALLKGRAIAGDAELGEEWFAALNPLVWEAAGREGFVAQVRAMRRRVVDLIPDRELPRQIKLGVGGLRDVEFTAQLLQLVHGRADENLHVASTLQALTALGAGGYISRDAEAALSEAYRFLRVVEHRLQLVRMQRTAMIPTNEEALRRLARAALPSEAPERTGAALEAERAEHSRIIRTLHEQIFYRPILAAAARLTTDEVRLSEAEARIRLEAFGYRNPVGAMHHIAALTSGVSRRAAIQRGLLPVLLDWFSCGVDPDAGLLAFRKLSENLGESAWYLRMLRDSGVAAQRVTRLLSTSAFVAHLLETRPAAVAWLDDERALEPRRRDGLAAEAQGVASRRDGVDSAIEAVRAGYSREVLRTAIREVLQLADITQVCRELTTAMDIAIDGAVRALRHHRRDDPEFRFAVIAMGRLGGQEIGFHSDADVMYVYDVPEGSPDDHREAAAEAAREIATELRTQLGRASGELGIEIDPDLRPEGKQGPLVRTLGSYRAYYQSWSEPWEAQALLRARCVAGDVSLGAEYTAMIDPLRYPTTMAQGSIRQVRRLKARMESERLPRGADPTRHSKLGRGGLTDVEWTAQLLQLEHAHAHPELRTTSTLPALERSAALDLISGEGAEVLSQAWEMASRVRSAAVLWRGRTADSLPTDRRDLEAVARICGYDSGGAREFEEDYLRTTRQARRVMERVFYGEE